MPQLNGPGLKAMQNDQNVSWIIMNKCIVTLQAIISDTRITMAAGCLMTQKILLVMQNSCACRESSKWSQLLDPRKESRTFARSYLWFAKVRLLVGGFIQNVAGKQHRLCLHEKGLQYYVKDCKRTLTKVVHFRLVFPDSENEDRS